MADKDNQKSKNAENKVAPNVLTRGTLASRMINPELFVRPVSTQEFTVLRNSICTTSILFSYCVQCIGSVHFHFYKS